MSGGDAKACFVRLTDVSLDLPVGGKSLKSLFSKKQPKRDGARIAHDSNGEICRTLKNISMEITSGERVGLIGSNGAGKTSLLRILAGIYAPTHGAYDAAGRISTLFTSTVGMDPNASGRDNIFLAGRTLGFSRAQIASVTDDIVQFAQLDEFIDLPVRLYSAGMKTRLGFAIVTAIQPEIVLIDEVFGAGDVGFRKRANERIKDFIDNAGILVMATHSPGAMKESCDRVIWLNQGEVAFDGDVDEGLARYAANMGA